MRNPSQKTLLDWGCVAVWSVIFLWTICSAGVAVYFLITHAWAARVVFAGVGAAVSLGLYGEWQCDLNRVRKRPTRPVQIRKALH